VKRSLLLVVCVLLTACAAPVKRDMSAFMAASPRSILVVPVVNKSLDVDAPNYVLSSLPVPIAEKGYYVFPVNTTKFVLEQEGLYEGERVREMPAPALAKLFDADAILYVTIERWDARYMVLSTTVTVEFEYKMVSRDGAVLWEAKQAMQWAPQNDSSGHPLAVLIGAVVKAAMARAAPNYMPLTQQANLRAIVLGPTAIPDGPYRPKTVK